MNEMTKLSTIQIKGVKYCKVIFLYCIISSPCYIFSYMSNIKNIKLVTGLKVPLPTDVIKRLLKQIHYFGQSLHVLFRICGYRIKTIHGHAKISTYLFVLGLKKSD